VTFPVKKIPQEPLDLNWIDIAYEEIGTKEIKGPVHNLRILQYHATCKKKYTEDEISWCSAFVNWCFFKCGIEGTNSALARHWLAWGKVVEVPYRGCVVIFWRGTPNGWKGHVGFWVGEQGDSILVLGGNQSDKVCIMKYPKSQLLGYRAPGSELEH